MDDELQQLEAELKRLRPVAPSRELLTKLERELGASHPASGSGSIVSRPSRKWWLWAAAMPAAAAIALLIALSVRRGQPVEPPKTAKQQTAAAETEVFKPVAAENVLLAARDEGLVTLDDGTTARRERLNYVDTVTWKDPRTNASVRWTVPREEVRVVPVKFQ